MALNLFPTTTRISWTVEKSPNLATRMQRAVSGREARIADWLLPLYTFNLKWEVLKDRWDVRMGVGKGPAYSPAGVTPYDELRQIWNFWLQQLGPEIPFYYYDPSDNTTRATAATPAVYNFAIGDGVTTQFQAASPILAPVVPIVVNSFTPVLSGGISVNADTGVVTWGTAPGVGVSVGLDMTYYYRVRFNADGLEASNFAYQFWELKQMKLVSVVY